MARFLDYPDRMLKRRWGPSTIVSDRHWVPLGATRRGPATLPRCRLAGPLGHGERKESKMGCLFALLAGFAPRIALVLVLIFTNLVDRAFTGFLVPLLGLILLPYATLFYA